MKKHVFRMFILFLLATIIVGFHNQLSMTEYSISNSRIPAGFEGYRIAIISDLHAERFGENQKSLVAMLEEADCDLICLLGDIVSCDTTDFSPAWELIDRLAGTPMVYVAGNNELSLNHYSTFLSELEQRGVTILDDFTQTTLQLQKGSDSILIHGYPFKDSRRLIDRLALAEKGYYNVLLYHDPYCFPDVATLDYDLMLSGHTHGGMIRFPLIGSPLEWLNIEPFTKGIYTARAATLIVSGGLGSHESLPRFFNAPEVVVVTLHTSDNP